MIKKQIILELIYKKKQLNYKEKEFTKGKLQDHPAFLREYGN